MTELALKILEGQDAENDFENQFIPELFGFAEYETGKSWQYCLIGCDTYDWSLEIYLYNVDHKIFTITPEQIKAIIEQGCGHFWINFQSVGDSKSRDNRSAELYCYFEQGEYKSSKKEF